MKGVSGSRRSAIAISVFFLCVVALCNVWTIALLINPADTMSIPKKAVVWSFDGVLIVTALMFFLRRKSMQIKSKNILFAVMMFFIMFVFMEFLAKLFFVASKDAASFLSPVPLWIADVELEKRPNPEFYEHDENGFRNIKVPEHVDIVALGDSQTYCTGVKASQAWPRYAERSSGLSFYNMAFGGFGPVHSVILLDEALELEPKVVIEAFYAGNDLHDSYRSVYGNNQLPEFRSTDSGIIEKLAQADSIEPVLAKARGIAEAINPKSEAKKRTHTLIGRVLNHSALYSLFMYIEKLFYNHRNLSNWDVVKNSVANKQRYCPTFESETFRTVLTPAYRLCVLDISDPRISEGHRLSLKAMEKISDIARERSVQFKVVLIPTKELVFKELVISNQAEVPDDYMQLINNEEEMWKRTKDFLEERSIEYIDCLPALRQCFEQGKQPYRITSDGHPNAIGCQAIAEKVLSKIKAGVISREPEAKDVME